MEEIEVPLEQVQENIHEAVHGHGHEGGGGKSFMARAAILSAVLAVLAAISALFAGGYANEAMMEQIQSSDKWAYYQAKGIKKAIAELKQATVESEDSAKAEKYKEDQEEIKKQAEEKEHESKMHLRKHESLAACVTFFQVAIAMVAIALLSGRKAFLFGSCGLGLLGVIFMIRAFLFIN